LLVDAVTKGLMNELKVEEGYFKKLSCHEDACDPEELYVLNQLFSFLKRKILLDKLERKEKDAGIKNVCPSADLM
jgi:hypothetical protein